MDPGKLARGSLRDCGRKKDKYFFVYIQTVAKPGEGCRFHTKMVRYGYFKQNAILISILECIRDINSAANTLAVIHMSE